MITIKEEIDVPSPRGRVWEVVSSPSDVVSCISGAELGAAHDDGSFDGALVVKFGAIRVRFAARIRLELDEPESEGRLTARGGDGQGATRFRGDATFRVVDGAAAGSARVLMNGEVTLTGKLASLVESGAGVVISRMTKDFSAKLVAKCAEPATGQVSVPVGAAASGSSAERAAADAAPPVPAPVPAPAAAPPRTGPLRRCLAWLARVLGRRRSPEAPAPATPTAPDRAAPPASLPHTAHAPQTTQTEEVGSGNAPAQ